MNKLANWIRQHQIVAFFAFAYAVTWGLGFSYDAVMNRGSFLLAPLVFVATCGPALAGIIVAAVCNTEKRLPKTRATRVSFVLAWIVSALVFLVHNIYVEHAPLSLVSTALILVWVVPVAFVISRAFSRTLSVRKLVSSLVRPQGGAVWYVLALLLDPILMWISIGVRRVIGRGTGSITSLPAYGAQLAGLVLTVFLYQFFFFNAVGEEVGWRGFAMPRLQAKTSPLVACLVIGLLWVPWHAPLWRADGAPTFTWDLWLTMFLVIVPSSVITGWLFNRSGGSILVAGITHATGNTVAKVVLAPQLDERSMGLTYLAFAVLLVVSDKMWRKLPSGHPAVHRSSEHTAQLPVVDDGAA
jgi:membrane protease YdiL (CAAX protease family)